MEKQKIYEILDAVYFSEHPVEEPVLKNLPGLLSGVRHFVDIGASLGQYTKFANQHMTGARIEAIEADPIRFERLAQNCAQWSAEGRNVVAARHAAVALRSGEIPFFTTASNVSGGLAQHALDYKDEQTRKDVRWQEIRVPGFSLDDLFGDAPPDFIKMDIEGAEQDALLGAKRLLAAKRTRFLIELHDFAHDGMPGRVVDYMQTQGYVYSDFEGKALFRPETAGEGLRRRCMAWARYITRRILGRG